MYIYMKKNVKRKIFVAGWFSRYFIWLLFGPQQTHSKRFCSDYSILEKNIFLLYIYIFHLYVKNKIFVAGVGGSFFLWLSLGPQWTYSNRFCADYWFSLKKTLICIYIYMKKKRFCTGGWNGGFLLEVIGTPMITFQQVSL